MIARINFIEPRTAPLVASALGQTLGEVTARLAETEDELSRTRYANQVLTAQNTSLRELAKELLRQLNETKRRPRAEPTRGEARPATVRWAGPAACVVCAVLGALLERWIGR
ncbi:MAG TPA: hypothetical protein VHC22_32705 [Pirellulales bacterium]|nr:hypothetical protein [Pirellulales bacterium]